ncbi:MAG TPA: hypothetical protein PLE55_08780 [Clostridiales bacterium]|nr:hypothetical protein [Clostridiales bacterium]
MERFVADQIKYGLRHIPLNAAKSFFVPSSSRETQALRGRGFIRGVCHPGEDYEQIKKANIRWVRIDIPFPYGEGNTLSGAYLRFKERAESYARQGIRVMAVTPYPRDYIAAGIDFRRPEHEARLGEIALFFLRDLKGIVSAYQITNEMGIPHFTIPVTMKEAARFIGLQLKAMHPEKGSVLIGYNSAGPQADLHLLMKPYHRYCDYVGIDIYVGCFSNVGGYLWFFDLMLRYLWAYTRKPLLLQEFGYIGGGEAKSKREKEAILRAYGVRTPQEAKDNILSFVEKLPRRLREHVEKVGGGDPSRYYGLLFRSDLNNDLYRELPRRTHIPGYPHTPQGQADFYRDILPRLYRLPYLCGAFIYCYSDAERCYICGQEDCPTETRWGLVDCAGREKPSYFSVRDAFGLMG